ncbi:hypothetical protein Tco_0845826, partial [Tanacetum coccineum]
CIGTCDWFVSGGEGGVKTFEPWKLLGNAQKLPWSQSVQRTVAFTDKGPSNSNIDKIMARMDAMTMKMDAQYKDLQSRPKQTTPDHNDNDTPMSCEEEAKLMQTLNL